MVYPVQKKYNVAFTDAKLDSMYQLYHVTDQEFTKSNPENVKAMRSFFESITGKNGNNNEFKRSSTRRSIPSENNRFRLF